MARAAKERTVRGVRPNVGLELWYRRKLLCFIDAMQASIVYWLSSAYKRNEPVMAEDAKLPPKMKSAKEKSDAKQRKERRRVADKGLPADELQRAVRRLARRWQRAINDGAEELADHFAQAAEDRSGRQFKAILGKAGITIPFRTTPAQRDILKSTVHANVALIRSIPAKHFQNVEQLVMESVQTGRDLGTLSKKLQKQYGVTKRRAALIARDQNNKATSAMTRARQTELGITKARWKHSYAGKHPRKSHVAVDGHLYDINTGMLIEGEYIFPGEKINCKCTSQSVIPGFVH